MFTRIEKCTPGAKVLGESGSAEDSVGWKKCDEAAKGHEMEIRHVGEKIVIREKWYENVFSLRPHHCVQHSLEAADGGSVSKLADCSRLECLGSFRFSWNGNLRC
jgi:hypothetical protein